MARTQVLRASMFIALCAAVLAWCPEALAEDPATDFKQNCSSCHTIGGGRLTGPDLKNVEERKERDWLLRFVVDPTGVLDSGDAYALKLLQDARNVRMPNIAGMSKKRAGLLLDLIAAESKLEKSQFAGLQIPMRPFTHEDIELGRAYYQGTERLKNGGAACISCHDLGGMGMFGGGRLGPDLTKVYERYEDRKKLAAWLSAPATATMLPTFRAHPMEIEEILPLVAYFEHTAQNEQESDSNAVLVFILLGVGGAACCLLLFNRIWAWRFRGVRGPLVQRASWAGRAAASDEGATR